MHSTVLKVLNRLAFNLAALLFNKIAALLLQIILIPILISQSGPSGYSTFAVVVNIAMIFSVIPVSYKLKILERFQGHSLQEVYNHPAFISSNIKLLCYFTLGVALILPTVVLSAHMIPQIEGVFAISLLTYAIFIVLLSHSMIGVDAILELDLRINRLYILTSTGYVVAAGLLLLGEWSSAMALAIGASATLAPPLIARAVNLGQFINLKILLEARRCDNGIKFLNEFLIINITASIIIYGLVPFIAVFLPETIVAEYAAKFKLIHLSTTIFIAVTNLLWPAVARLRASEKIAGDVVFIYVCIYVLVIPVIGAAAFLIAAPGLFVLLSIDELGSAVSLVGLSAILCTWCMKHALRVYFFLIQDTKFVAKTALLELVVLSGCIPVLNIFEDINILLIYMLIVSVSCVIAPLGLRSYTSSRRI